MRFDEERPALALGADRVAGDAANDSAHRAGNDGTGYRAGTDADGGVDEGISGGGRCRQSGNKLSRCGYGLTRSRDVVWRPLVKIELGHYPTVGAVALSAIQRVG